LPQFSLEELAERIAGQFSGPPATPAAPDLQTRLAESERRREAAEADLRREQDKKQEIKKAVQVEMSRLEAELAEARNRIRRKDEEHAAALQTLNLLKDAKQDEWNGDRMRLQGAAEQREKALKALEARLGESQKSASEFQAVLDASRAEVGKLHAEVAAANAERAELRRKLGAADAKLQSVKDASAQLEGLKQRLQEAQAKAAGLQTELEKKDQRMKELQLLIKTLGERLNDLADRAPRRGAPEP
jgi:chromosome segregation ATPase